MRGNIYHNQGSFSSMKNFGNFITYSAINQLASELYVVIIQANINQKSFFISEGHDIYLQHFLADSIVRNAFSRLTTNILLTNSYNIKQLMILSHISLLKYAK